MHLIEPNVNGLILCLCVFVVLVSGYAQGDDPPGVVQCAVQAISEDVLQFDGKAYPRRFELKCPSRSVPDPRAITFVLVEAGATSLEGLPLRVEKPFYIATDVLSIRQALALQGINYGLAPDPSHEEYVKDQTEKWEEAARDQGVMKEFSDYLNNPRNPYFVQDYPEMWRITEAATRNIGVLVRVPTLAEWTLAMQGGSQSRFWWGDDWPPPDAAIPAPDQNWSDKEAWRKIEEVETGKPNPFGLYHMIGNVKGLVFPSEAERQALLAHLRPGGEGWRAKRASWEEDLNVDFNPDYWRGVYTLGPYSFLTLGGSAFSRGGLAEQNAISLSMAVGNHFPGALPSHPLMTLPVGIRLVMPLASAERIGLVNSVE